MYRERAYSFHVLGFIEINIPILIKPLSYLRVCMLLCDCGDVFIDCKLKPPGLILAPPYGDN